MGKKEKKKKPSSKKHTMYTITGSDIKQKNKTCPKCGTGIFMAQHKDRLTCGKCGYTEFTKKE